LGFYLFFWLLHSKLYQESSLQDRKYILKKFSDLNGSFILIGLGSNLFAVVNEYSCKIKFLFANRSDDWKEVIASGSISEGFDIGGMGFGSVVDKKVAAALIFKDLFYFFADFLTHSLEDFGFLGFLSEEREDLHESINKFFEQFDLILLGGFVVVVSVENVFFKVSSFVVDGIEAGEVIAVFLDLFKTLLDGEREMLDDVWDVILA
jgi:hypothetical protein